MRLAVFVLLVVGVGCAGDAASDGGPVRVDGGDLDVSVIDGGPPSMDAGALDAPEERPDAPPPPGDVDLPPDTALRDAPAPLPEGCITERCNRRDDDCDGRVDESACRNCTTFTVDQRLYLHCTSEINAIEYLTDACERLGPGYAPASLDDTGEQILLSSHGAGWVGIYRGSDRVFRRSDASEVVLSDYLLGDDTPARSELMRNCVSLENDLVDLDCSTNRRAFFCEARIDDGSCVATTETCDGDDDDCDGRIDESGCPCDPAYFFGHRYAVCNDAVTFAAATTSCEELAPGASLATIEQFDEALGVTRYLTITGFGDAYWIGHTDEATEGVYLTLDGREVPLRWSVGEPNNLNGTQDCVALAIGGGASDLSCRSSFPYVCEFAPFIGP